MGPSGDPLDDPRVLRPDHAPTPFTAAQIRAASPSGRIVETRTDVASGPVERRRVTFLDSDDDGTTMRSVGLDEHDAERADAVEQRVTWGQLQSHASFPAVMTTVTDEVMTTELGELRCLRYDVDDSGSPSTFWFSVDHPGMPVRFTTGGAGGPVTTVTSISSG